MNYKQPHFDFINFYNKWYTNYSSAKAIIANKSTTHCLFCFCFSTNFCPTLQHNLSIPITWIRCLNTPVYPWSLARCTAKGRTNIELREQFILADGVSQSMTAFKPRISTTQSPTSTGSRTSSAGPITKVGLKHDITC